MKLYKFAVHNWRSDIHRPFWFYKAFPSAYAADRWATRITYGKGSHYIVSCIFGEEIPKGICPDPLCLLFADDEPV